jgi:hypothetical protein
MQTLKQQTIDAISKLHDMAGIDDIMAALRSIIKEKESTEKPPAVSCFDLMKDYIGCVRGPEDLSSNKSYMDDYGKWVVV